MAGTQDLEIRPTHRAEVDDVVSLASRSLGWAADERDRAFFRWKHHANPLGASPSWAAYDGSRMVAFRTLLRWRFVRGGERQDVVRAVDTATDPDYQGRGLFRRLTTVAVESLTADGIDAVFNTPNEQSRPGYLKMGWIELGRPTLMVHPSSPIAALRMLTARVPAEKWSIAVSVGAPVSEVLEDLTRSDAVRSGWSTERTRPYLEWRYGFEPLHYRAVEVRGGHVVFRVRTRGPLREVALVDWLSPSADPAAVRRIVRAVRGDYVVAVGCPARNGFVPIPRQGPIVTWRPLARTQVPSLAALDLRLGDLELF